MWAIAVLNGEEAKEAAMAHSQFPVAQPVLDQMAARAVGQSRHAANTHTDMIDHTSTETRVIDQEI